MLALSAALLVARVGATPPRRALRRFNFSAYNNSCYYGGEEPHLLKVGNATMRGAAREQSDLDDASSGRVAVAQSRRHRGLVAASSRFSRGAVAASPRSRRGAVAASS